MRAVPPSYEQLVANFDWSLAERELDYRPGDPINIGWMCSDRISRLGLGNKFALLWEDYQGNKKPFTYDDLRILSNTIAQFLCQLGIRPTALENPNLTEKERQALLKSRDELSRSIKDHQTLGHKGSPCFEE
jgi:hypothetical protein